MQIKCYSYYKAPKTTYIPKNEQNILKNKGITLKIVFLDTPFLTLIVPLGMRNRKFFHESFRFNFA